MTQHVDSASDDRTANNSVRHAYRVLSDAEKASMVSIKDAGAALIQAIRSAHADDGSLGGLVLPRDLQLAVDHAEDAVMRAVRHVTA